MATVLAILGWSEATHLDISRTVFFGRVGRPIETPWGPLIMGAVLTLFGGSVAWGILRGRKDGRRYPLFDTVLLWMMLAIIAYGAAALHAGQQALRLTAPGGIPRA